MGRRGCWRQKWGLAWSRRLCSRGPSEILLRCPLMVTAAEHYCFKSTHWLIFFFLIKHDDLIMLMILQVMRVYFPSILALAQSMLRSPDPCVVSFGRTMYLHSFSVFDSYCQQVVHAFYLFIYFFSNFSCFILIEEFSIIWNAVLYLTGGGGLPGDPCVLWCGWGGGHISGAPLWSGERKLHRNGSICCFCQGTVK